jgi:hypothetical protein
MGIEVDRETAGESGNLDSGNSRCETHNAAAECPDAQFPAVAATHAGPPESPGQTPKGEENANTDADATADRPAIGLDSLIEVALQNLDGD